MTEAPYFAEVADGPSDARALWLTAADGVRLRAVVWNGAGPKGTVLLIPGRTEYIEKYGRAAGVLAAAGYATLCLDVRGQGLADRAVADRMVGHVADFAEFQRDVDAALGLARDLPQPLYLMSHSMGGCIALRALMRGLPFRAAAFSAPMWGILMSPGLRAAATILTQVAPFVGLTGRYAPSTGPRTYVLEVGFDGNTLTTDAEMWEYMRRQVLAHPDLALGGPSIGWLKAAMAECAALRRMPSPPTPVVTALGTNERVVASEAVHDRMGRWASGRLDMYGGAEHEVMMERPATRAAFLQSAIALFGSAQG